MNLTELPMELLQEITGYLEYAHIFNLSKTCLFFAKIYYPILGLRWPELTFSSDLIQSIPNLRERLIKFNQSGFVFPRLKLYMPGYTDFLEFLPKAHFVAVTIDGIIPDCVLERLPRNTTLLKYYIDKDSGPNPVVDNVPNLPSLKTVVINGDRYNRARVGNLEFCKNPSLRALKCGDVTMDWTILGQNLLLSQITVLEIVKSKAHSLLPIIHLTKVRKLVLNECDLQDENLVEFSDRLTESRLEYLDLGKNKIASIGGIRLASGISKSNLQTLVITGNSIGLDASMALLKLQVDGKIKIVMDSINPPVEQAVQWLPENIQIFDSLQLSLGDTVWIELKERKLVIQVTIEMLSHTLAAIRNSSLNELYIEHNKNWTSTVKTELNQQLEAVINVLPISKLVIGLSTFASIIQSINKSKLESVSVYVGYSPTTYTSQDYSKLVSRIPFTNIDSLQIDGYISIDHLQLFKDLRLKELTVLWCGEDLSILESFNSDNVYITKHGRERVLLKRLKGQNK
ncbi:hypothetical protein HK103_003142 [Boothiomyces macroporosus]|uniref:F-box domain-containing protein n=1 Tax=Boothiomyces macroporosus TaxID=261099 RepID=A0AAD5Y4D9_9FUNG|nr:hypothetical protein HK103_003142 [Boothiomyces macroporosus]